MSDLGDIVRVRSAERTHAGIPGKTHDVVGSYT
jgi:hypothetical protein